MFIDVSTLALHAEIWKLHHGLWDCLYVLCIVAVKLLVHWMRGYVWPLYCSKWHLLRWIRLFELLQQFHVWMDDCFKPCTWWQSTGDIPLYQLQHSAPEWHCSRARMYRHLVLAASAACWAVWRLFHHKSDSISYRIHEGGFHIRWQHQLQRIHWILELCKHSYVFRFHPS